MNLKILMRFTNKTDKNHSYTKAIEFCGISDFEYDGEYISFIEYGRLKTTIIDMSNVIKFTILTDNNDD